MYLTSYNKKPGVNHPGHIKSKPKDTHMKNTKGNTGNRYTDAQKKEILNFIQKSGRGGISAAQEKYGVSYIAIRSWKDKGLDKGTKPMKAVLHQIPAKRGRPFGSKNNQPNVQSNRPGRPSSDAKLVKALAGIRSTLNKAETKFEQLESLLQPA